MTSPPQGSCGTIIVIKQTIVFLGVALSCIANAKEPIEEPEWEPEPEWNMCTLLEGMGDWVYRDKKSPVIQGIKFTGRAHVQYGHVEGEGVDGEDFSKDFEEVRRLRFGTEVRFLKYFELEATANFASDRKPFGGDRHFGYQSFHSLLLSFDLAKAFDLEFFDDVVLSYGRHKLAVSPEAHRSSRKIKTVERSAVSNKVYPSRATGLSLNLAKNDWSGAVGVFSTGFSEELAGWDDGRAYYLTSTYELESGDEITFDVLYNDANGDLDNELTDHLGYGLYEWAASAAYVFKRDRSQVVLNAVYGDNGSQISPEREGKFFGLVVMPSYWVLEDQLEAIVRYSYQESDEANGIRMNGRYGRREHGGLVNDGRGDQHQSLYAGLNLHFCEGKSKIMTGIEYETLDTDEGDGEVDATTLWLAYRMYF